ncbi:DUF1800 domain-containing protein [Cribrihabitans neustonicus]|uniref:DUF1800 domain-containing protein n=1 Tax=Cribrihabitans neustonicus TaxID=1429085 RepID=UPI003B5A4425
MAFDAELAALRFGTGLSPDLAPPASAGAMLSALEGPDRMAERFPVPGLDDALETSREYVRLRRKMVKLRDQPGYESARKTFRSFRREQAHMRLDWHRQRLLRWSRAEEGFRERLTLFWADHFTAQGKAGAFRHLAAPYAESVIRPHLAARFEDMLSAAVTSPLMLHYLDQNRSAGPGSRRAERASSSGRTAGLNENLAREVLELHTLGVGGPYTQDDVRQLAELFTGLTYTAKEGFTYQRGMAEPGAEIILGRSYGGGRPQLEQVLEALRDLARHPATARHLARKLAVHFLSDQPPDALVQHLEGRYLDTGGDLPQVYAALLEHPSAWQPELMNVKPPFDFIASACRALGVSEAGLAALKRGQVRRLLLAPLTVMGQRWEFSSGPDGWPEADSAWITPQALAARLRWSMSAPRRLLEPLPDPRVFAEAALGQYAGPRVEFAARAAETESEGVGLVLASPAFQRR